MTGAFAGKVVVVSGASRGIGRAIAEAFAREGADTVLAATSAGNLAAAASAIEAAGGRRPATVVADLRSLEGCEAVFKAVEKQFGRCDILVNNAGAAQGGDFLKLGDDVWQDGFELKFFGAVRLTRLFWPMLAKAQGHVVNIIGSGAKTPTPNNLIVGAVNAAFANFSKGLSKRGMADGVNVNAIHPGRTETDRTAGYIHKLAAEKGVSYEAAKAEGIASGELATLGQPEDVAALALFLCSPGGRHIKGTAILVDGGGTPGFD
jgi:NAD(P)-dependent dehydrogenase (short-subunit alcohol dehydrogenase family)